MCHRITAYRLSYNPGQNRNQKTPAPPPKPMLNENRSHKQQHSLRGKAAGLASVWVEL